MDHGIESGRRGVAWAVAWALIVLAPGTLWAGRADAPGKGGMKHRVQQLEGELAAARRENEALRAQILQLESSLVSAQGQVDATVQEASALLTVGLCGDPCTIDSDGDGFGDCEDPCPCDPDASDSDGDGNPDCADACPADASNRCDDPCAADEDGDGIVDCDDVCPGNPDPNPVDSDGDGSLDCQDPCPGDADDLCFPFCLTLDDDGDGMPDCPDANGDGIPDFLDPEEGAPPGFDGGPELF